MARTTPRRWFITGVSSGFGHLLACEAARRGDKVVGTVRNAEQSAKLKAAGVHVVLLDVNDAARTVSAVAEGIATLGGLDILVNNAGFGLLGAIEALDEAEIRGVMETNFFGMLRVTRAALPELRAHGGVIVNISSVVGMVAIAGGGAYSASKFAVEGLSEALAQELAPFGVKVLIVEPGGFRTDFAGRSIRIAKRRIEAYAGTQAGEISSLVRQYDGTQPGDPAKAVAAILAVLDAEKMPLRLVLGKDAIQEVREKQQEVNADIAAWEVVSTSTDFS